MKLEQKILEYRWQEHLHFRYICERFPWLPNVEVTQTENVPQINTSIGWPVEFNDEVALWRFVYNNRTYVFMMYESKRKGRIGMRFDRDFAYDGKRPSEKVRRIQYAEYEKTGQGAPHNGCQIGTMSAITGNTVQWAEDQLRQRGWTEKNAGHTSHKRWDEILSLAGMTRELVWDKLKIKYSRMSTDAPSGMTVKKAAAHFNSGKYIVVVKGHVLCIIDGVIHDNHQTSNNHVRTIWKVENTKS